MTEVLSESEALDFQQQFQGIAGAVNRFILGKPEVVDMALVCLLAEGHLLLEDVPGVGKTSLARAIAGALGSDWMRIQFTPDLLPSDVTGVSVFHQRDEQFVFHPGPIFTNIVLADEINRASPRTQSALLEVMEERHVTVDGEPHHVPRPFMVIATQNPVEMDGTYPLPEAQLDRFLMKLSVGYPDRDAETFILEAHQRGERVTDVRPVLDAELIALLAAQAARVHVSRSAARFIVDFTAATRAHHQIDLGASPRASVALLRASRVLAASRGRNHILPEDVLALVAPVIGHRIVLSTAAQSKGLQVRDVLADVGEHVEISLELIEA